MQIFKLQNEFQTLEILNYGATIYRWFAFTDKKNIVISNLELNDYLNPGNGALGSTVGRVANRIKDGKFTLNNKNYELEKNFVTNHGHGGSNGFLNQEFLLVDKTDTKLVLKYNEPSSLNNYPGNLEVFIIYELNGPEMSINYFAKSDEDTICNITNHTYFNISDETNVLNHKIKSNAFKTLEVDELTVPTGKIINNKDGLLDLNKNLSIKEINDSPVLNITSGLDTYFLFEDEHILYLNSNEKTIKIETSYPGFQLYTMQFKLKQDFIDSPWEKYRGIAIETQFEPDAINHNNFSNIILRKDKEYNHFIKYTLIED